MLSGHSDFLALMSMNPQVAADAHERAMAEIERLRDEVETLTALHASEVERADTAQREGEQLRDERDEWKLRAERAEAERDEISASLEKADRKWKQLYHRLTEYEGVE